VKARKATTATKNPPKSQQAEVARDKKLIIEEEEADRVRTIFQHYLELGGIGLLLADLRERGIVTKVRHLSDGRTVGGIPFTRGALA
jgi:site-specific DNA recombinase